MCYVMVNYQRINYRALLLPLTGTEQIEAWIGVVGDGGDFTCREISSFPTIHMTADQNTFINKKKGRRGGRDR